MEIRPGNLPHPDDHGVVPADGLEEDIFPGISRDSGKRKNSIVGFLEARGPFSLFFWYLRGRWKYELTSFDGPKVTKRGSLMIALEQVAKDLHMNPEELMKEGLKVFLRQRLKMVESELFLLSKKYGVNDVFEFDKMVKEGKFHEEDSFEDYFKFDNLEAERDLLLEHVSKV